MKILVAGATGLVGTALCSALAREGHTVCRLVRPQSVLRGETVGFDVAWDPETGGLEGAAVGADAVVNLSGASIADGRWTEQRKLVLRTSRVNTTRALVNAIAKMSIRPRVMISASAIGYYGNRDDEILNEDSASGTDFLPGISREWEAEATKAEALRIRVVKARFGIILAKDGGALPQMMRPFRFGVGGRIGNGKQWMSWIALEDVVEILKFALENNEVSGAINVVSPQPVRNAEFTKELAKALHRPALFPAPAFALRAVLGEMADALLLTSQRVMPTRLERLGYQYHYTTLASAFSALLENG